MKSAKPKKRKRNPFACAAYRRWIMRSFEAAEAAARRVNADGATLH